MATCNTATLLASGKCFACLTPGEYWPLKLTLLCQIAQNLNAAADCSVNGLLQRGACFTCLSPGEYHILKLSLLCQILSGAGGGGGGTVPSTPTNLDIDISSNNGDTMLTWSQSTAPSNNLIERSINNGVYVQIAAISGALTTYTDSQILNSGDLYRYRVRGENGINMGAYSNTVAVCNNLTHDGDGTASLVIDDLIVAYSNFVARNLLAIVTLSFPRLKKVISAIDFTNNFLLNTISLPSLKTAGQIAFDHCTQLTTVTFTVLNKVTVSFQGASCTSLAAISAPALTSYGSLGGNLNFNGCVNIVTASFPSMGAIPAATTFTFHGCVSLTTVTIPTIVFEDGMLVDCGNCSLNAASINSILHRGVVSLTTTGDYELSGGANAAPSGAGIADKMTLQTAGNLVNTN